MNSLILSGFLSIGQPSGVGLPERDAPRYILKALYREYGIDEIMKRQEKRYMTPELRQIGTALGIGIRIATEKRLSYEWKF